MQVNASSSTAPSSSYYRQAEVQLNASGGPRSVQVDRELADAILQALAGQGDGRISLADMQTILAKITDGPAYGQGEKPIARMLLAACDDRKNVQIDGQRVRITDGGEDLIRTALPQFWGSLGGKAAARNDRNQDQFQTQQSPAQAPQANVGGKPGQNSLFALQINQNN